jgi:colanic acid biosynthesis glycosyl transferase WcaI
MKLLLVSLNHHPELTGIGKYQGEMAAWLAGRGHEVRVVTAPPYYPAWKVESGYSSRGYRRESLDGARVYRVPLYVPATPDGLKRLIHMASFAATSFPLVLWQAIVWRPDAIISTVPPLSAVPAALLAGLFSGARTHLHVQDFEVDAAFQLGILKHPLLYRIATAIEGWFIRSYASVSTISPKMRERLLAKGVSEAKTSLVPNWAGVEEFDPAVGPGSWRERLDAPPGTVLAVYSGNMGRKQGLEMIVDAARILKDRKDLRFVMSGEGSARGEIEARAAGLDNIRFLPLQPSADFVHLLVAADIHLLPQRAEAADLVMPSKLGNMLASGRPVVAGAVAGTQLYDAIDGCGIGVEPGNAQEFARAIASLADSAVLRTEMGQRARQRALEQWSRDAILEGFLARLQGGAYPVQQREAASKQQT